MTVIAYRDGVLASDSLATRNDIRTGNAQKIHRLPDGARVGLLGARGEAETLMRWYEREYSQGHDTAQPSTENSAIVVITAAGELLLFEDGHGQPMSDGPFQAFGTGAELAMGAMTMGASAVEAVAAAIEHDIHSGGPVFVLEASHA